ncbi:MAG: hypothetical protein QG635_2012, partial [Bacteroidota bacterium]|nr:hypothetical protein [Bacteroidota bacterium]
MEKVFINKIGLSNIACFDSYELELGRLTRINGANGAGKSTIAKSLLAATSGGNPVEIIRNGEKKGEIGIEFSDGITLHKIINKNGKAELTLTEPNGQSVKKPQSFLNELIDAYSFNPVSIITASGKERLRLLLEAIPMKAQPDDFRHIFGDMVDKPEFQKPLAGHALDAIETYFKQIYEARTNINSQLKSSKTLIVELSAALPEKPSADISSALTNLRDSLREKQQARLDLIRKSLELKEEVNKSVTEEYRQKLLELNKWRDVQIEEKKEEIDFDYGATIDAIDNDIRDIEIKRAGYEGEQKNQAAYDNSMIIIDKQKIKAAEFEQKSKQFTTGLEQLEAMKSAYLSKLPIEGLDVKEGEIYYKDVPFDSLNTQTQIDIVAAIS